MNRKLWTSNEEKILQEWLNKLPEGEISKENMDEICKALNRTDHSIYSKIRRMSMYQPYEASSNPINLQANTGVLQSEVTRLKRQVDELISYRKIPIYSFQGDKVKIGITSDTHMGSLYERLDLLNGAYDIFQKEDITAVYHAGDIVDGEKMYKGHEYEIRIHGADAQIDHCTANYPKRDGIKTHFIVGNHDLSFWKSAGIDVGRRIADERDDMFYLGREEADIGIECEDRSIMLRLSHPGKGTAYALSYHPQKYIDSLSGGQKPHIICMGHYHKAEMLPCYRNIYLLQAGCLQSQTPYMRRQSIAAHMGFWILEFMIKPKVLISRFKAEFIAFYEGQTT